MINVHLIGISPVVISGISGKKKTVLHEAHLDHKAIPEVPLANNTILHFEVKVHPRTILDLGVMDHHKIVDPHRNIPWVQEVHSSGHEVPLPIAQECHHHPVITCDLKVISKDIQTGHKVLFKVDLVILMVNPEARPHIICKDLRGVSLDPRALPCDTLTGLLPDII